LVIKADLAENSAVRGCMVIKPYGYAIWEKMQRVLDDMFKETGHVNAYFPLLIPKSFLSREAEHVEGFAKECAVVTHYRLKTNSEGSGVVVDPAAKLEEELIIRPTSETIIWNTYRNWIQSYRDLPILCNQWANVMRWEMRTRLFLRTAEFLWQEGHTAHATREEAEIEAKKMQEVYANFAENYMAMPVVKGVKSASERFAGALDTYTIEAMMQDGKALQAGTSHFLGQNFGKAFEVTFIDKNGKNDYAWATSWGVSTRLIGALIMSHSDDNGLVLPPKLAPIQVVIVPIYRSAEQLAQISEKVNNIMTKLKALGISVKFDDADNKKPGWKFAEYELKGVPVRLAMGGRDLENNTIEVMRRDTLTKETVTCDNIETYVQNLLEEIQQNIFQKALNHRAENTISVDSYEEFKEKIEQGYFIMAHWDGTPETEELIKNETKATIRCIPLEGDKTPGTCMVTGKPSAQRVLFARAY
jgi:prolyl-tRNA synthetase